MGTCVPPQVLVAGEESVGRQLLLRSVISQEAVHGRLTGFQHETGQHRFLTHDGQEEWVSLANRAYQWMSPVSTHACPNPTFRHFPGNHEAIGWKVKVYWNEMGRWYTGRVKAYDQVTGFHKVKFCDGDVRWYKIRDEAVIWIHKLPAGKNSTNEAEWKQNVTGTAPEGSEGFLQNLQPETKTQNGKQNTKSLSSTTTGSTLSMEASSMSGRNSNAATRFPRSLLPGGMKLRPRKSLLYDPLFKNRNLCLARCRVGVFWSSDHRYYRATIQEYNEGTEKYRLLYDDNQEDEVDLEKEAFKWFGPKGVTAGYTAVMKEIMISLGAENIHTEKSSIPKTRSEDLALLSSPVDIIGRKLFLYWEATGEKYEAEVLAYDGRKKLHYLWYRDGELEWVDLKREAFVWGDDSRMVKEFPAGLEEGEPIPRGKAAVGWRIAVYWRDDVQFYDGKVSSNPTIRLTVNEIRRVEYDSDTGRHKIDYDDGESEKLSLSSEKVIWKASPSTNVSQSIESSVNSQVVKCSRYYLTYGYLSRRLMKFASKSQSVTTHCVLPEQPKTTTRKVSRGTVSSPKHKRQRLPSPVLCDLAKENHAGPTDGPSRDAHAPTEAEPTPVERCFEFPLKGHNPVQSSIEEDDDYDLYPITSLPPEPLPPLNHTRLAKLPSRFGASTFQVRIVATDHETDAVENGWEAMMQKVLAHQMISEKMGRMPSGLELTAADQLLSKDLISLEYPTKTMTGQETVTTRVGYPIMNRQGSLRGRSRKKGRCLTYRKPDDIEGHTKTLESILSSPVVSQISPKAAGQSFPPVIAPTETNVHQMELDYSKNLFDAARCGSRTPFANFSPSDAICLLDDPLSSGPLKNPPRNDNL